MNSRVFAPILFVGSLAFACGPHPRTAESKPAAAIKGAPRKAAPHEKPLATALDVTVSGDSADRGVTLALRVTNTTDKQLELDFPSGRTHDFVVLDSTGREIARWSTGRMFTQTVQNKLLGSDASVTYQERLRMPAARGRMTAVAILHSSNYQREKRVEFSLR